MKKSSNSNKISSMHDYKKKGYEKSEICLSIKVFIDFGANTVHSVNMGNENVEAGKVRNWNMENKACVPPFSPPVPK